MKPLTLVFAGALVVVGVGVAYSGEQRTDGIVPRCWEENHNGTVERHCEVPPTHRDIIEVPPDRKWTPEPESPSSPPSPLPPMRPYAYAPGYQSTLPPQYWPGVPQGNLLPKPVRTVRLPAAVLRLRLRASLCRDQRLPREMSARCLDGSHSTK